METQPIHARGMANLLPVLEHHISRDNAYIGLHYHILEFIHVHAIEIHADANECVRELGELLRSRPAQPTPVCVEIYQYGFTAVDDSGEVLSIVYGVERHIATLVQV